MKELNKDVLVKMIKEQIDEMCGVGPSMMKRDHGDHEGSMARQQMYKTMNYAQEIYDNLPEDAELPAWVQSKLTKIADYVGSVKHYLEYKAKHGMHFESLQEQDEMETAGGAVTIDVDTKQLAQLKKYGSFYQPKCKKTKKLWRVVLQILDRYDGSTCNWRMHQTRTMNP